MPAYETTLMISSLTSRKRTIEVLKRVVNTFLDRQGVVTGINSLGQRKLAYDIRENKVRKNATRAGCNLTCCLQETHSTANYTILNVYCSPASLREAHKIMRFDDNVLRFMTIKKEN